MDSKSLQLICERYLLAKETNHPPMGEIPSLEIPKTSRSSSNDVKDSPLVLAVHSIATFNNVEKADLHQSQQDAIKAMELWIGQYDGEEMAKLPSGQVKDFILNFSRAFFVADLAPEMINFQFLKFARAKDGKMIGYGHQSHRHGVQEICVDYRDWSDEKVVKNHKIALLGTIMHECIHAYLCAFCCDVADHQDPSKESNTRCSQGSEYWDEGHGHFAAWFHLAAAVNIALENLLGLGTDLSVFRSVLLEYSSDGARMSPEEWKRAFAMFGWQSVNFLVQKLQDLEQIALSGKLLANIRR